MSKPKTNDAKDDCKIHEEHIMLKKASKTI